uniref:Uncharacterized protein n=1 Tax=Candidatus Kentrum sp. TC TaxID=2126339 RepID=A0A450Y957_9GAMM|nr:MAG: hypothetical protein BECKTC1821D_GA0114238_100349 [Candidatus Kentron sp. TC]VFK38967.1 MAG: hypothetical protein BECKTC1821E_GA0114239_100357 [Candidatus Kentron sp. TC]
MIPAFYLCISRSSSQMRHPLPNIDFASPISMNISALRARLQTGGSLRERRFSRSFYFPKLQRHRASGLSRNPLETTCLCCTQTVHMRVSSVPHSLGSDCSMNFNVSENNEDPKKADARAKTHPAWVPPRSADIFRIRNTRPRHSESDFGPFRGHDRTLYTRPIR